MTDEQLYDLLELEGYRITLEQEMYAHRATSSELSEHIKELTLLCEPLHGQIIYPYSS